jgi:hypothetical protein
MSATSADRDPAVPPQESEPGPAPRHTRFDALTVRAFVALAAAAGVVVLLAAWLTQRRYSQWFADDFLYLQLARDGELTPSWLVKDNYGHFAPLTRLAYFLVQRTVGLDYATASLLPAALVTTIFLAQVLLYRELFGRRPLTLVVALVGTGSVPVVKTMLWWGAAVHVLGAAALMTLCVATFVVYSRHGQERYRIASVVVLAGALLVQERPILTIGYLVLIRYLFGVGLARERGRGLVLREALFWLPWAVVEAAYLVYRVFVFPSSPAPGDAGGTLSLVGQSIFRGYAPSLAGTRVDVADPLVTVQAVAGLLMLLVATAMLVRFRKGAWRTVAFLVAIYVVNLTIVAAGRLDVSSVATIVVDLQYYVDVHIGTLMAFGLGFATLPARESTPRREGAALARVVFPVATAALAVSTVITVHELSGANQTTAAHAYVNRVEDQLEAEHGPYDLLRTKLPLDVAPTFLEPFTSVSDVFALDHDVADRIDPTAADRLVVTSTGRVVAAHPSTQLSLDLDATNAPARVGTIEQTADGACLSGPAGSNVLIKLPEQVASDGLFYALTYTSDHAHEVRPVMRGGDLAYNQNLSPLPAGTDVTVVDRLDGHLARSIVLGFEAPVHDLCLQNLWIGRVSAQVQGGCRVLTVYGEPARRSSDCDEAWPVG